MGSPTYLAKCFTFSLTHTRLPERAHSLTSLDSEALLSILSLGQPNTAGSTFS